AASIPDMPGMLRSMMMRSGFSRRAASMASNPSIASPHTTQSSTVSSRDSAFRTDSLSSTTRMRARALSIVMSGAAILLSCWGLVGLLLSLRAGAVSAEPRPKNVLLLFSDFGQRTNFLDVFETSLRAQDPDPITFYEGYLDPPHGGEESYLQSEAETLRGRFSGLTLDAVVAAGPSALQFAVKYRDKIFPGVPI